MKNPKSKVEDRLHQKRESQTFKTTCAPNGVRYLLVGGMRQRDYVGINFKPRKTLENAQTPTSQVHAVLGGFLERQTPNLKPEPLPSFRQAQHKLEKIMA